MPSDDDKELKSKIKTPNTHSESIESMSFNSYLENTNLLNIFSRVSIFSGKYPNDATLRDYTAFQTWMYTHANKHAPIDICQSLTQLVLHSPDRYAQDIVFHIRLICAEAYQTVGHVDQALGEYDAATVIAASLNNTRTRMSIAEISESDRKRKKLDDVRMKLKFQSDFKSNLIEEQTNGRFRECFYSDENE